MDSENSILRLSNVLNLTRQEFSVIEKHILHFMIKELKHKQIFKPEPLREVESINPLIVKFDAAPILKNSKNIGALKNALRSITSRSIFFDFSKEGQEYFGSFVPFTYSKYYSEKGSGSEIEIHINHVCKKLFLELANGYTNIQLDAILSLKSEYSIRMYELMSMYINQGKWTIQIEDIRLLLNLGSNKYKDFYQFKRFILEYSQKELWEHCNIHFEWEIAQKKRKKITALTFHIKERNKQERKELSEEIKATQNYVKELSPADVSQKANWVKEKYTLTEKQFEYILANKDVFNEFIRVDLIIEDMITKGKPPRNRTKYLAKSLGLDKVKL